MTEERITRTEDAAGNTHTSTTVVRDGEPRSGGGGNWVMIIVLVILAIGAFVLFSQMSGAEVAKDQAVTDAANSVGEAAGNVGDAAQDAADNLSE